MPQTSPLAEIVDPIDGTGPGLVRYRLQEAEAGAGATLPTPCHATPRHAMPCHAMLFVCLGCRVP
ncbi:hypothetical protein BO70DRAFT_364903 [Aspergillus heteromorphus CBS 117.55]|uniref:Uncharacterized protein n=1 Tax=Aspergillus heteromorphus CBS 117.55 TaxID=1448321 RepID=A0A317VHK4_9EURO|nr:uncharacterized protein BO70DRAFT_364903 [Aspergillus heteromorphus CBS 117.55]PWY72372.1 hypothetical protein BO70DRAFT_364903 [Aspergillus heteromorphus CBS 117.55]